VSGSPKVASGKGDAKWTPGNVFFGVQSSSYWSDLPDIASFAWKVSFLGGNVQPTTTTDDNYVWPVRFGQ
jgi:hypothetical protein